jgi:hypothetical protein
MTRGLRQRNGTCNVPGWSVTAKPGPLDLPPSRWYFG